MVLRSDKSFLHPNSSIKAGVISIQWTILARELHTGLIEGLNIKERIIVVKSQGKGHVQKQNALKGQQLLTTLQTRWAIRCLKV